MAGPDPRKPKPSGKIGLPPVDAGMNRVAPSSVSGGKGSNKDPSAQFNRVTEKAPSRPEPPPFGETSAKGDDPRPPEDDSEQGAEHKPDLDEENKEKLLARAKKRFQRASDAEGDNRRAGLDDDKFFTGEQWPAAILSARQIAGRPAHTINKLPVIANQITNDLRMNRPSIHISPVGDRGDPEVAKMYYGLIRAIERDSAADIATDTAMESAVRNGLGYIRCMTEWDEIDSFDQVITIKRVRNRYTVYMDPGAQEPDGSDAKFCFISEMVPRSEFEQDYPDASPMPWTEGSVGENMKEWIGKDEIRIAEYFEFEHEDRRLVKLSNGHVGWYDELGVDARGLIALGSVKIEQDRISVVPKLKWYKITAVDILSQRDWPGRWIPVVPVIGNEVDVEGRVKLSGIVRYAKDPQQMYNYWRTLMTEMVALQPKAPWLVEEGQIEGHEDEFKNANVTNAPFLSYKGSNVGGKPAPPPSRQPYASVPQGIENALQGAAQDIMGTTGIRFDSTLAERTNDESGKALRELARKGDIGAFQYGDNLARALRQLGRIIVDLIPKIYDEPNRMVTILREDDSEERVQLNPNIAKPYMEKPGQPTPANPQPKNVKVFNAKSGRYGVTVTVGPSYATKRIEASENMIAFAKAMPQIAGNIADLIAKNMDWPGAQEMATRLAKMLPPQLLTPEQKDMTPQVQALLQSLQRQIQQMGQERQQLVKALTDQGLDRQQRQDKIDNDFEAKVLKIIADVEKALNVDLVTRLEGKISEGVGRLETAMTPKTPAAGNA